MRVLIALAGVAMLSTALYLQLAGSVDAADVGVTVQDSTFDPTTTTINVGDRVVWTWAGTTSLPHTVTAEDGSFDSPQMTSGTFSHTFNTAGTFPYICEFHGAAGGIGMTGTIVVQQAAPTATGTTSAPTATATDGPSRTPTRTPTGTVTAVASATPVATLPVDPTAEAAAPISAPATSGGAGAGVGAPQTGEGAGATATRQYDLWGITIGAAGVLLIAGAAVLRRRKP